MGSDHTPSISLSIRQHHPSIPSVNTMVVLFTNMVVLAHLLITATLLLLSKAQGLNPWLVGDTTDCTPQQLARIPAMIQYVYDACLIASDEALHGSAQRYIPSSFTPPSPSPPPGPPALLTVTGCTTGGVRRIVKPGNKCQIGF